MILTIPFIIIAQHSLEIKEQWKTGHDREFDFWIGGRSGWINGMIASVALGKASPVARRI